MSSNLPESVLEEVKDILDTIKDSPPSKAYDIDNDNDLNISTDNDQLKCGGCFRGEEIEIAIQECEKNTICKQ